MRLTCQAGSDLQHNSGLACCGVNKLFLIGFEAFSKVGLLASFSELYIRLHTL